MNLADMAAQVCADTGYLDTDDLTFAKQALRMRDDLLWRVGLWKDSLVQVNLTVDPETNEDHAEGVVYLPEVVERVVAVRTADHALAVSGLETFYRAAFDTFATTGDPWEFAKLAPGWFTFRGYSGIVIGNAGADDGQSFRAVWRDTAGVQYSGNLTLNNNEVFLVDTPLIGTLIISGAGTDDANGTYTYTQEGGGVYFRKDENWYLEYTQDSASAGHWSLVDDSGHPPRNRYRLDVTTTDAVGSPIGTWTVDYGVTPAPSVEAGEQAKIEVEAVFKGETTAAVTFAPLMAFEADTRTMALATTVSPRYQRIRLLPIPVAETTLKILAKAQYVPLDFDYAEPKITGSHLCLMAFAKHALRKRAGEHGAAEMDLQEATGLLETLKREELQQEANNQRIIPSYGYGDQWFGPGRDGFFVG